MARLRRWWPVLFLALVPLLPLWRAVFLGEAIGPWDQIRAMAPWNGPTPRDPWDVLQADAVLQVAPWRSMVLESWSRGEMPLWNPYQLLGTPLLANSQSASFYPPHILLGVLKIPPYLAITFLAWLHLFWAGLGVMRLVQRLDGSRIGGVVAGASFSLSSFMLAWTALPSVITTVSWIPWVLAAILSSFSTEGSAGKRLILASLSVAMMLLAGHLQFAAYGLMAAVLIALWMGVFGAEKTFAATITPVEIVKRDDMTAAVIRTTVDERVQIRSRRRLGWKPLGLALIACVLGGLLAAPQLVPSLDLAKTSHRQGPASEDRYRSYLRGALGPEQLVGVVFPSALGHPRQHSEAFPGTTSYWPAFFRPGANYAESAFAIGPLVLALLFLLPKRRWTEPGVSVMVAFGILGLLVAFGTPLNRLLYFGVPGWAASGSPGRASVLFVLAACALAGLGASRLVEDPPQGWKARLIPVGMLLAAMFLVVTGLPATIIDLPDPFGLGQVAGNAMSNAILRASDTTLASGFLVTALTLASFRAAAWRKAALLAMPLVLAPLLFEWKTPIPTGRPVAKPVWAVEGRIAVVNDDWQFLAQPKATMPPNLASLFGLHDVGGYDSLLDRDTKDLLDSANGKDSAPAANGNMMFVKPGVDWDAIAAMGVTEVWANHRIPDLFDAIEMRRDFVRHALPGQPRASTPAGKAEIVYEGFDRLRLRAVGPGTLVLRDRNAAGWTATVDGSPTQVRGEMFREVELTGGQHIVEFSYRPPALQLGFALFFGGFGILVLIGILVKPRTV